MQILKKLHRYNSSVHYYFNILKGFKEDAAGGKRHSLSLFPFFAIDCCRR